MYFALSRVISYISYFMFGFPRDDKRLIQDIEDSGAINDYKSGHSFSANLTWSQLVVLWINISLVLKNFYPLYYIFGSINELKGDYLNENAQTVGYGCLKTNCTSRVFLRYMTAFPVFTICQHEHHWLFPPATGLQPNGLILQCMYVYFILLFNVVTVIYIYFKPMFLDAHLFQLLPNVGRMTNCEDLRKALTRIYLSMINLHTQCPQLVSAMRSVSRQTKTDHSKNKKPLVGPKLLKPKEKWKDFELRTKNVYFEQNQLLKFNAKFADLDCFARVYISDCLTFFRSQWWHAKSIRIAFQQSIIFVGSITAYIAGVIYIVTLILRDEASKLSLLLDQVRSTGCEIWINDETTIQLNPLSRAHLIRAIPSWNNTIFAEFSISLLPGLCFAGIIMSWFQQAHAELISIMAEQIDRVTMAIEITRLLKATGYDTAQGSQDQIGIADYANLYSFDLLKQYHMQNRKLGKVFRTLDPYRARYCPSDFNKTCPISIAMELVGKRGQSIPAYQELLTKIYVNNSTLSVMFTRLNVNVETALLALFSITYGFVGILIYINRKFGEATEFTLLMGLWGILLNSIMVYLPSKLHSLSRILVNSMWRLLVANIDFKDIRVRHLRTLLLRQLGPMCYEGGLSLRACGIPVTYGSVIKLALWSATLIVISFNP